MRLNNGEVLLAWPLAVHCVTAGWLYNDGSLHRALDFRAAVETPVYAAEDGVVTCAYLWNGQVTKGDTNSYGNFIKLRHENYGGKRLETLYAHLKTICVKTGQSIKAGQLIGYSGVTGNCRGAHLHFEVRLAGVRYNPLNWLDGDFTPADNAVKLGLYHSVARPAAPAAPAQPAQVPRKNIAVAGLTYEEESRFWALAKELGVEKNYRAETG